MLFRNLFLQKVLYVIFFCGVVTCCFAVAMREARSTETGVQSIPGVAMRTHRFKVKETHPDSFKACQGVFDRHLSTTWSALKKNGVQHTTFMQLYMPVLELLCDLQDLSPAKQAVLRLCNGELDWQHPTWG